MFSGSEMTSLHSTLVFSKQTEARPQDPLFTGLACWKLPSCVFVEKLTPRTCGSEDLVRSQAVAERSQMPNATLTKGNAGKMCALWTAAKACFKLWRGFNVIQMWTREAAPLFTSVPLCDHVLRTCECEHCGGGERRNNVEDAKRFVMVETECVRHGSTSSTDSAWKLCW